MEGNESKEEFLKFVAEENIELNDEELEKINGGSFKSDMKDFWKWFTDDFEKGLNPFS